MCVAAITPVPGIKIRQQKQKQTFFSYYVCVLTISPAAEAARTNSEILMSVPAVAVAFVLTENLTHFALVIKYYSILTIL